MLAVVSEAFTKTAGLIIVFGGIGVVVNAIIAFIAFRVRGEQEENRRYLASSREQRHS